MNVFTALVPALYYTLHLMLNLIGSAEYAPLQTWESKVLMAIIGFACAYDMWTSFIFHLYNSMGKHTCQKLLTIDMSGTVVVIGSTFISIAFRLFSEWSEERKIIMGVMIPMIICNFVGILHPAFAKESMHCSKVIMILTTLVLQLVILTIGKVYMSTPFTDEVIYPRILTGALAGALGFFFFLSRFPERSI